MITFSSSEWDRVLPDEKAKLDNLAEDGEFWYWFILTFIYLFIFTSSVDQFHTCSRFPRVIYGTGFYKQIQCFLNKNTLTRSSSLLSGWPIRILCSSTPSWRYVTWRPTRWRVKGSPAGAIINLRALGRSAPLLVAAETTQVCVFIPICIYVAWARWMEKFYHIAGHFYF